MKRLLHAFLTCFLVVLAVISLIAVSYPSKVRRIWFVTHLFSDRNHIPDFQNMGSLFPTKLIRKSDHSFTFPQATLISLPAHYVYKYQAKETASFLQDVDTTGLLILHGDKVVYENYWR